MKYSIIFLLTATLTGLSRIYLAQHFLLDVMAGSLIGVIIATAFYIGFERYLNNESTKGTNTPDEDLEAMDLDEDIEEDQMLAP